MRSLRTLGPSLFALPLSAALGWPLAAQMHHMDRPTHVTRAVGVYEWTGDMAKPDAARLIPVSLFIDGHFQDAGVYLAHPIPFALETGNVYEIERSGNTIGTLDLEFARNIVDKRSAADDNPLGVWYGYGKFLPPAAESKAAKLTQHSATPAVVVGSLDDSRPHFVNRSPADDSASTADKPSHTPSPSAPDDPDRPHMKKRDADSTDNAPSSPGTADIDNDPDRPTLGRRDSAENKKGKKQPKESGSGVEPMRTSLNEDPDRPSLHRGKVNSETTTPQLTGVPPNVHQAVAVSDAANNPTHVFTREWGSSSERAETLAAMQKLADPLARQYLAANHLQPATATASSPAAPSSAGPRLVTTIDSHTTKPGSSSSTAHTLGAPSSRAQHAKVGSASTPLPFTDEQISGFTLSYGGLPTFVYTAAVSTRGVAGDGPPVRVTLVAQRLPSGELQTSLSSVTDEAHLDRNPWMRLVDAVDPNDSHRADLLFELRAHNSRQFALYSLATAQAQQTFTTGVLE